MNVETDIEITDEEAGIIKLAMASFINVLREIDPSQSDYANTMADIKEELGIDQDTDLQALAVSAFAKFDDGDEEVEDTQITNSKNPCTYI